MSGRIRSVKPEWLEDELLALASDAARVLTIGLMLQADDYGNGRANPILLAGQVFPGKVLEHTANALAELVTIRFVSLYEVDGQRYFHIRSWEKHQRVDKPGKPRVPPPPSQVPVITDGAVVTGAIRETPAKVPETLDKPLSSRASDRGPDPGPDRGPGPGQPRDSKALAAAAIRDPMVTQAKHGQVETWPEVIAVCDAFAATYGRQDRPRHQGDPRARAILSRLAEGHTVAQLEAAVRGSKFASHIADNQAHQALVTILRDSSQVDKFSALTEPSRPKGPPRRGTAPLQSSHGQTGFEGTEQHR